MLVHSSNKWLYNTKQMFQIFIYRNKHSSQSNNLRVLVKITNKNNSKFALRSKTNLSNYALNVKFKFRFE